MSFFKEFQNSMCAATFAEANEHRIAEEYLRCSKNRHKKVLLATDFQDISIDTLLHGMNFCKRMGSSMEIFHLLPGHAQATDKKKPCRKNDLRPIYQRLGIDYSCVIKDGVLTDELVKLADNRRDILTLLVSLKDSIGNRAHETLLKHFHCPVVFLEK